MANRHIYYTQFFLTGGMLLLLGLSACGDQTKSSTKDNTYISELIQTRQEKDKQVSSSGVIEAADLQDFKGLKYYSPEPAWIVRAGIKRLPPLKITFRTTTDRLPEYYTFARLDFKAGDSACSLIAYASDAEGKEGLFIPFGDLSNKTETYGGGRYLDIAYRGETDSLTLDFNTAYNPYCHYNHSYSCPLVPAENKLNIQIKAGEKRFKD